MRRSDAAFVQMRSRPTRGWKRRMGAALAPARKPLVERRLADLDLLGDFWPRAIAHFTGGNHTLAEVS